MPKRTIHLLEEVTPVGWGFKRYRSVCGFNVHRPSLPDNFTTAGIFMECVGCEMARLGKVFSVSMGRKHKRTSWLVSYRRTK